MTAMIKKELREVFRTKRKAITVAEKLKLDDLLLIQFQNLSFKQLRCLFSYFPKENYKEPNTLLFSRYLSHFVEDLKIAYPVVNSELKTMNAVLIDDSTEFVTGNFGILEPVGGKIILPESIDLVFIPLLCFDKKGYRVGFGGGYYDKYLIRCRKDALKIGFSYFEPVESIDDKALFDVPLDFCITPEKIYEFK